MSTKQDVSRKIRAHMNKNEDIQWQSKTNVLPQVIGGLLGALALGAFLGLWAGGFFGVIALVFTGNASIAIAIAAAGFLLPMIGFIATNVYEARKEEFVLTDDKLITLTANNLNADVRAVPRDAVTETRVEQSFVGDMMGVGDIKFELAQTELETDLITFEGIDNPYEEVKELRNHLSSEIKSR
jgi:hypothetical protein